MDERMNQFRNEIDTRTKCIGKIGEGGSYACLLNAEEKATSQSASLHKKELEAEQLFIH